MNEKLLFKFNGGYGAVLCNNCHTIVFSGNEIPQYIWCAIKDNDEETLKRVGPVFCCEECKEEFYKK